MKTIPTQKSLIQIIVLVISLFLTGCYQDVYKTKLKDVEQLRIEPKKYNHGVYISIKGYLDCSLTLYILADGNRYIEKSLTGKLDTAFRHDWYDDVLSFELERDVDCSLNDIKLKVKMLD